MKIDLSGFRSLFFHFLDLPDSAVIVRPYDRQTAQKTVNHSSCEGNRLEK
jgi:hypothetical protein